jgi:hypothetical protein
MTFKHQIHIIAFLQKEHLKEFGNYAQPLMREESQSQWVHNGIINFRKPMQALVKMDREF